MKGLLIILLMMLAALHAGALEECIRVETTEPAMFDVDWCSQPVTTTLPEPIGYCANARCRSSHKTHHSREIYVHGIATNSNINILITYCLYNTYTAGCCRSAVSEEKVAYGLLAQCPADGQSRAIDVRYTTIKLCECTN